MMTTTNTLRRLQCGVNSYEWGKRGESSMAARFAATTPSAGFVIQPDEPYAELWMGSHPSNPSKDVASGRALGDLIVDNPSLLSDATIFKYGTRLPFLFKILCIDKALSIQAHPNKSLAEQLHAQDPGNYPDDNHKPEMAVALTPFEGLCGFRPVAEISYLLQKLPPLQALVTKEKTRDFVSAVEDNGSSDSSETRTKNRIALRRIFTSVLHATAEEIKEQTDRLVDLAIAQGISFAGGGVGGSEGGILSELVIRNHREFGYDIGLFILFFLNYVRLEPGEAIFLQANEIHAYLSGDVIECMATSNNVVRAGFTPKFKDVVTLASMLTYNYAPVEEQKMVPIEDPHARLNPIARTSGSVITLYDPPVDEFKVSRLLLKGSKSAVTFAAVEDPSIFICISGSGTISVGSAVEKICEGHVFFVGPGAEVALRCEDGPDKELVAFKASC